MFRHWNSEDRLIELKNRKLKAESTHRAKLCASTLGFKLYAFHFLNTI